MVLAMPPSEPEITDLLFGDGAARIDPLEAFDAWLAAAEQTEPADANAMALATVDGKGMPDNRIVLLKARNQTGFVFFTNLESAKGAQLSQSPRAALNFHWKTLGRQVRVRGPVAPVEAAVADTYFASRPRGSQIGAHASDQSRPLPDRATLEDRIAAAGKRFGAGPVPRPPHWSGFALAPLEIEFWRNSDFRLHDRMAFTRAGPEAAWSARRLFP